MRFLVVYAHPVEESFCSSLRDTVVDGLRSAGHDVHLTDLYAEAFEPALIRQERLDYHTVGANTAPVQAHVDRLMWAEALIFVFPTWWYGMPAILKGYFDRVWLPGVAFHLDPVGPITGGLHHIHRMGVVTTYGSPWWFMKFYMREPGRAVLMRGLRPLINPKARKLYLAHYAMDRSTHESRTAFRDKVARRIRAF